jgi:hypothetical protein
MGTALPNSSYKMPLGTSKWRVGKSGIIANIDLNESLFSDMGGIRERHYNYASGSDDELQRITNEFIQPYVNKRISVSVNGKPYPVKVSKLVRHDNSIYTIWLSIDNIAFDRPQNNLKIEYRMLFEELKKDHMNQAYLYRSDATGDALQKIFDNFPAEGQHDFTSDSTTWELSVKGAAAVPQPPPAARGFRETPPAR